MREIRFRMWTGSNMLYSISEVMECLKQQMAFDSGKRMPHKDMPYDHRSDSSDFMQFTGLKDKNDVEIYDGDVLRFVGGTCTNLTSSGYHNNYVGTLFVVSWLDSGWTLQLPTVVKSHAPDIPNIISNVTNYDFWNHQRSLEVIGNIHQNPELL